MNFIRRLLAALCASVFLAAGACAAFPDKSIRIVVPFPPGGAVDAVARLVANHLTHSLKATVVVDNKPGGGGSIGVDAVAKAPRTGYELLLGPIGPLTINPSLYEKLPYDTVRNFDPIVLIAGTPAVLVVHPGRGIDTVRQFVDALKANPGTLNYRSAGNGNLTHLVAEYFLAETRTRAMHVPYKGSAPAITDFLGRQFDFMFDVVPTARPYVQAGRFKALAVTSLRRSSVLPDVPTLDELGYNGFDITSWWGLMAPKGTPPEVVRTLNAEINRGLQTPEMREALANLGADPLGGSPEQFSVHIRQELVRWKTVVVRSGAKVD